MRILPALVVIVAVGFMGFWVTWNAPAPPVEPPVTVALVNSQTPLGAGRYDTWESPRGESYSVPQGNTLRITSLTGLPLASAGVDVTIEVGYGTTAVTNSVSAPADDTVLYAVSWRAADGPALPIKVDIPIPANMFPFVSLSQPGNIQAEAVLESTP